jgi:hypothetical protein
MRVDVFVWGGMSEGDCIAGSFPSSTLAGGGRPGEEGVASRAREGGPGGKRDAAEANVYGEGNHETKPPLITLLSVDSQRSADGTKGEPHL